MPRSSFRLGGEKGCGWDPTVRAKIAAALRTTSRRTTQSKNKSTDVKNYGGGLAQGPQGALSTAEAEYRNEVVDGTYSQEDGQNSCGKIGIGTARDAGKRCYFL